MLPIESELSVEQCLIRGIKTHDRPIRVYQKNDGLRSSEEKWGVPKLRSKRIKKKLLVLGSGRSGTMFTAKALTTVGINVLHEKVGEHGTVSHYFVTDSEWYPMAPWQERAGKKHVGERRSDFDFEHVVHIIRDPRKSIPSMTKIFGSVTWQFYIDNGIIPDGIKNPMLRAMYFWLAHNQRSVEQANLTFPLEGYEKNWPKFMELIGHKGVEYPAHLRPMNKTSGFKKYEPLTFEEMVAIDKNLGIAIRHFARGFGYKE